MTGIVSLGGSTPGGSTTQLQYNNSGAFAGLSTLTTDGTNLTLTSASFGLSGNITGAGIIGTSGIRYKNAAATLTDTTSTGTITTGYTDIWGGNTIAASAATTVTNYYGSYFKVPVAGTNITLTNNYALGADSLNIAGSAVFSSGISTVGVLKFGSSGDTGLSRDSVLGALNLDLGNGTANDKSGTLNLAVITATGNIATTGGNVLAGNGNAIGFTTRSVFASSSDGVMMLSNNAKTDFTRLQFGGTTSSFPSLKRSSAVLQGRLADDSAFAQIQAKLTTDTNATTGLTGGVLAATTNASIVLYDGSGQAYRVPCII